VESSTEHTRSTPREVGGDGFLAYRDEKRGMVKAAEDVFDKAGVNHVEFALQTISKCNSSGTIAEILLEDMHIARLLPMLEILGLPRRIKASMTILASVFSMPANILGGFASGTEFVASDFLTEGLIKDGSSLCRMESSFPRRRASGRLLLRLH
jgi:hypothetical protein